MNRPNLGVDAELDLVRAEGLALIEQTPNANLHAGMFRGSGKLLRPRLLLLCAAHGAETGAEPDWQRARAAALAIELGHLGSLYHDDIVDRSEARRGRPSVHRCVGVRRSVLGGAELIALCNSLMARLPSAFAREWGRTAVWMADGQLRDIENAGNRYVSIEAFVKMASRKTGAAFELAASFGARLGSLPTKERAALLRFGRHFGVAFQLANDVQDFCSSSRVHRIPGNDLRERVYSLPVIIGCAMRNASGARLRMLLEDDGRIMGEDQLVEATELLVSSGAIERAAEFARSEVQVARDALAGLSATDARDALDALTSSVLIPSMLVRNEEMRASS